MNKSAQALGRLAKGKPKNYSREERERRRKLMEKINARKADKTQPPGPLRSS